MNEVIATANDEYYSKQSIINWINNLLKINIQRIEQLGTGAIYCQIIDMIYPGHVLMQKINWKAKYDYEFASNFRILQNSFQKLNIQKPIEVEKLIKCKCSDNLEFVQWLKKFYDANYQPKDYDPINKRSNIDPDFSSVEKMSQAKQMQKEMQSKLQSIKTNKMIPQPKSLQQIFASSSYQQSRALSKNSSTSNLNASKDNIEQETEKPAVQQIQDALPYFDALKSERDFFYDKLKNIDTLLDKFQNQQNSDLIQSIKILLYSEPNQMITVNEDGSLSTQVDEKIVKGDESCPNKPSADESLMSSNPNTSTNNIIINMEPQQDLPNQALKDIQNYDITNLQDNTKKQLHFDSIIKPTNFSTSNGANNDASNIENSLKSDLNDMLIEDDNLLID